MSIYDGTLHAHKNSLKYITAGDYFNLLYIDGALRAW